eukprot:jgi/Mesen1/3532/ME000197S02543
MAGADQRLPAACAEHALWAADRPSLRVSQSSFREVGGGRVDSTLASGHHQPGEEAVAAEAPEAPPRRMRKSAIARLPVDSDERQEQQQKE